ncbi:MAG TPA: ABC transporter ATP-binding protein [Thermoanaerobaculia bacterium]|nr:ABC transporter ATP-binding protein [Thermoanaerobaculia bacterium]
MNALPASLSHVTKSFGPVVALGDVSFDIAPGEVVSLLGPNGAGKTTAVRLLLGLAKPGGGTARVFGNDPRDPAARTRSGAMLQVARVPETLRVREHIELFSSYYPKPMPLADVLDAAGLRGLGERLYGKLSGGQKQRVLFALAICGDPELLILDEPTAGLDVEARRALWEQIRGFVRRGRSVLLTTHYLAEADALADRIVVIDRGRIVAEGTPAAIKARAAGRKVRCHTLINIDDIASMPHVINVRRDNGTTEIATTDSDALVRTLLARDPSLSNIEIAGADLEEAFVALTERN